MTGAGAGAGAPEMMRVPALDGLRAVAVIAVALFHYLVFWTPAGLGEDLVAYGDAFAGLPLISAGGLGVELFFIISGFVILMSLERSRDFFTFACNRIVRLWPPLILLGSFSFLVTSWFGPAELRVSVAEFLVSLLFLPPEQIGRLIGEPGWRWLDGAFWSLWVEVRFYAIIGAIFFLAGRRALAVWLGFEIAAMTIGLYGMATGSAFADLFRGLFFEDFIPHFSLGMAGYLAYTGRKSRLATSLAALALIHMGLSTARYLSVERAGLDVTDHLILKAGILIVFYLIAWRRMRISFLEWRPLTALGRASYGYYILHQNVGLALLAAGGALAFLPAPLMPLACLAVIGGLSLASRRYLEAPIEKAIKTRLRARPALAAPAAE